jgi:hypothetical protein
MLSNMRTRLLLRATRLLLRATFFALAVGAGVAPAQAQALEPGAPPQLGASDTARSATVHAAARGEGRWYCTPTLCKAAPSSPASAAIGFAATSFAAVWLSRRRPAERC